MTVYNESNWAFVVVASDDEGRWMGAYAIEQCVNPERGNRGKEEIRNQVERYLFHKWRKTGHTHSIIYEGSPEMVAAAVKAHNECPF